MNSASSDQCEERGMDMVLSLGGAGGVYKVSTHASYYYTGISRKIKQAVVGMC